MTLDGRAVGSIYSDSALTCFILCYSTTRVSSILLLALPSESFPGAILSSPAASKGQLFPNTATGGRNFSLTNLDTTDWTPASAMGTAARAYMSIIDGANKMTAEQIRGPNFHPTFPPAL